MTWKYVATVGALTGLGLGATAMVGCDAIEKVAGKIVAPGAELNRVDLLDAPTAREFARYGCHQILVEELQFVTHQACKEAIGNNINPANMEFSFDIVFDLANNNEKVPIPLVEILLGTTVYNNQDLGAVCISFCDPDAEECDTTTDAETACDVESAKEVDEPADLVPTVDDLTSLAQTVAEEGGIPNDEFRVIPAQDSIEAHIQFDFNIVTVLNLGANIIKDLAEDYLENRSPRIEIPYSMEGNLFFNVPEMGRYAAGFGPISNEWKID